MSQDEMISRSLCPPPRLARSGNHRRPTGAWTPTARTARPRRRHTARCGSPKPVPRHPASSGRPRGARRVGLHHPLRPRRHRDRRLLPAVGVGHPYAYWPTSADGGPTPATRHGRRAPPRQRSPHRRYRHLHEALVELSISGPNPSTPMGLRRLAERVDTSPARSRRAELADPVSDAVLLTFEMAVAKAPTPSSRSRRSPRPDQWRSRLQEKIAPQTNRGSPRGLRHRPLRPAGIPLRHHQLLPHLLLHSAASPSSPSARLLHGRLRHGPPARPAIATVERVFVTNNRRRPLMTSTFSRRSLHRGRRGRAWAVIRPRRAPLPASPLTEVARSRLGVPVESVPTPSSSRTVRASSSLATRHHVDQSSLPGHRHQDLELTSASRPGYDRRAIPSPPLRWLPHPRRCRRARYSPRLHPLALLLVAWASSPGPPHADQVRSATANGLRPLRPAIIAGLLSPRVQNTKARVAIGDLTAEGSGPVIDDLARACTPPAPVSASPTLSSSSPTEAVDPQPPASTGSGHGTTGLSTPQSSPRTSRRATQPTPRRSRTRRRRPPNVHGHPTLISWCPSHHLLSHQSRMLFGH